MNKGDEKTRNNFEEIYYTYSKYLYSIGLNILRDEGLAEEALQQCFLKIFQNIDKINSAETKRAKSFISIIMQNESKTIYRKYKKINSVTIPLEDELYTFDENDNVEEILSRAEIRREMQSYINILSPEEQNILILKYVNDYSYEESSAILDITCESARRRLSRIRKKLAALIIDNEGNFGR